MGKMDKHKLPDETSRKTASLVALDDCTRHCCHCFWVRAWQQRGMLDGVAPDFERGSLNGSVVRLADYQGKPLLLHFWASWCPMCNEQGSITAIANDHPVVTVAFQSAQAKKCNGIGTCITEEGCRRRWQTCRAIRHFQKTSYVLDGEGNIRFREVGLTSGWGLRLRLWLAEVW